MRHWRSWDGVGQARPQRDRRRAQRPSHRLQRAVQRLGEGGRRGCTHAHDVVAMPRAFGVYVHLGVLICGASCVQVRVRVSVYALCYRVGDLRVSWCSVWCAENDYA